jgi:hypothetical protein
MISLRFLVDRQSGRLMRITIRDGQFEAADRWRDGRWQPAHLAGFYAWLFRDDVEEIPDPHATA